ncbi:MAG: hypothetical protein CMG61_00435 [Candidatus Marinimicrobia bacterium]|nr:hypothetical protein [Candidatus Neomarinimicrobiota bacterium]
MKKNRLEDFIKNPKKSIWKLSIPMMLGMSVQAIYTLIDTAFIGRWVGWEALAGLGVVFPALFIIMGITFGLGSGATTVIAQSIGQKNKEKADFFAQHTIILGIFLSAIFIIIGFFFGENILSSQGAKEKSFIYAYDYFFTLIIGTPFMILGIFFRSILSGEGDTILPMKILGFGTILNIILDPLLIPYFNVKGAAAATVISQFIVFISFVYIIIFKDRAYLSLNFKNFKLQNKYLWPIFKIGIPSALSMLIMSMGIYTYNIILSKTSNPEGALAAYATVHRIEHLFFIPLLSLSTSMITIVGMFYGAKKYNLIKIILKHCIKYALIISISFGLFFFYCSNIILPIFINDTEVVKLGVSYFNIFSFAVPFVTLSMICSRTIQGLGKSYPMFIITCLRVIIISCSFGWYFIVIKEKPVEFAWLSILISCICASIISIMWLAFELKKIKKII